LEEHKERIGIQRQGHPSTAGRRKNEGKATVTKRSDVHLLYPWDHFWMSHWRLVVKDVGFNSSFSASAAL
jgi:hypothetical protein